MSYTGHADTRLLHGCVREAERCELASYSLDGLRNALPQTYHAHMIALTDEIQVSARVLRDIISHSQKHASRVPVLLQYLNVILPCLSQTLRDIDGYIEDRSISMEMRWRKMYHKMMEEASGIALTQRFALYNHFLTSMYQLLTRDANFDLNTLEVLRDRVMDLREKRGIAPPPTQVGTLIRQSTMLVPISQEPVGIDEQSRAILYLEHVDIDEEKSAHWAQQIFSLPLPSRTTRNISERSVSCGPHRQLGQSPLPPDSIVLFRRSFDNDALSLTAYINRANDAPYIILQTFHQGLQWFSLLGVHELRIRCRHEAVEIRRWSYSEARSKLWAALYFITWEEMVLFYCTFASLKARALSTVEVDKDEFILRGERRLFQAQIIDDGFKHSLIVFEDIETKGIRLLAAVWEGQLRQCPVWTTFVTNQCMSPTWLVKKTRHKVWLKDVQLYVFCAQYRQEKQHRGREGAFEIDFLNEDAASRFREVFFPPSSPMPTDSERADSDRGGRRSR